MFLNKEIDKSLASKQVYWYRIHKDSCKEVGLDSYSIKVFYIIMIITMLLVWIQWIYYALFFFFLFLFNC